MASGTLAEEPRAHDSTFVLPNCRCLRAWLGGVAICLSVITLAKMPELKASAFAIPAGSALVGGVVGALLAISLVKPKPETTRALAERTTPGERAEPAGTPLDDRVARLERSVQELGLRDGLGHTAARANAAPGEAAAGKAPVADVAPLIDNPVFEAAVRDVLDRAEQERNVERESQRAEWRQQASEEWASSLTEKLRLTDMQKAKALTVATTFWEKLRDLRQGDAGPPLNRQELRTRMDELRSAAEAELSQVLSASQMNSYRELDEASRLGSRRSLRASERGTPAR
jgi:hypothetical protein